MFHYLVSVLVRTSTILVMENVGGLQSESVMDWKNVENQVSSFTFRNVVSFVYDLSEGKSIHTIFNVNAVTVVPCSKIF